MKFFKCEHCGNIIAFVENKGVPVMCCGQKMVEIIPGSVDAAAEKHVPVVTVDNNKVTVNVGSAAHPMTPEHKIDWVAVRTDEGWQRKELHGSEPKIEFMLTDSDKFIAAYAYCNLHGLWEGK